MAKKLTPDNAVEIEKIIKSNPQINQHQIEIVINLLGDLQSKGIKQTEYEIVSPFSRTVSSVLMR